MQNGSGEAHSGHDALASVDCLSQAGRTDGRLEKGGSDAYQAVDGA
jgi:hypothetical protein